MITTQTLNAIMSFDHVIEVHEDGSITDAPNERKYWAPELIDGETPTGWELLNGYSGQDGYGGPIMHDSEFIGGGMEHDIRNTPGVYVALINYVEGDDPEYRWCEAAGWAVARLVVAS